MKPDEIKQHIENNPQVKMQVELFNAPQQVFNAFIFDDSFELSTSQFHHELYRILDKVEDKELDRVAIAAPRGHGKSQTIAD